jgi:hypothetical protein
MKVRGGCGFSSLMEVKKREKLRCLLLHRRKNFLFIYEVFVKQKIKNALLITTGVTPRINIGADVRGEWSIRSIMTGVYQSSNGDPLGDGRLTVRLMRRVDWTC